MRSLTFDELFAMLSAVQLSASDLARLREWIASIAHPTECTGLIEQAARGRPCPRCAHPKSHRSIYKTSTPGTAALRAGWCAFAVSRVAT